GSSSAAAGGGVDAPRSLRAPVVRHGRLAGEVALVTGSTSGIGRAIAERFAAEGASVLVTGRDDARGADVVQACDTRGAFVRGDLSDPATAAALVDAGLERCGRLSVVLHNAASGPGDGGAAA